MSFQIFLIHLLLLMTSLTSQAFVENVSHGYSSCITCHTSPSGGDLLNDYGRSLSNELMSTWGWENSEKPFFGVAENREWLRLGGDYRSIQTYLNNSNVKQGKQFDMQKNFELGFRVARAWVIATFGTQEGPPGTPKKGEFLSERHYILWDVTDEIRIKAGKFRLSFGLNDPNHTRLTKQNLGFGSNTDSYILEFSKISEKDEIFISADLGRLDLPRHRSSEKSFSFTYSNYVNEKSKIGFSTLVGESPSQRRSLIGIHGAAGVLDKFVLKSELDFQQSFDSGTPTDRTDLLVGMGSLGYKLAKGLLPYFITEHLQQGTTSRKSQQWLSGVGLQWLPIPHIELQAEFKKQTQTETTPNQSETGWILFHLYL